MRRAQNSHTSEQGVKPLVTSDLWRYLALFSMIERHQAHLAQLVRPEALSIVAIRTRDRNRRCTSSAHTTDAAANQSETVKRRAIPKSLPPAPTPRSLKLKVGDVAIPAVVQPNVMLGEQQHVTMSISF